MPKPNEVFDLSVFADRGTEQVDYTTKADLDGYEEVAKATWPKLQRGAKIKYEKLDGTLMPGGYIKSIWGASETDDIKIELCKRADLSPSATNFTWSILSNGVKRIWSNSQYNAIQVPDDPHAAAIDTMQQQIKLIRDEQKIIKQQMLTLLEEHRRIVTHLARKSLK
jgi:hypothetical protein